MKDDHTLPFYLIRRLFLVVLISTGTGSLHAWEVILDKSTGHPLFIVIPKNEDEKNNIWLLKYNSNARMAEIRIIDGSSIETGYTFYGTAGDNVIDLSQLPPPQAVYHARTTFGQQWAIAWTHNDTHPALMIFPVSPADWDLIHQWRLERSIVSQVSATLPPLIGYVTPPYQAVTDSGSNTEKVAQFSQPSAISTSQYSYNSTVVSWEGSTGQTNVEWINQDGATSTPSTVVVK